MPIIIDLYSNQQSWLHRVDPRVKLLFVASSLLLLLVLKNVFIMLAALVLVHLLHLSAHIARARFVFIWKTLMPVSIVMFSLWVVFYPAGAPIITLWIVRITSVGLAQGLVLAFRIVTMAFVVFAWLYTTDQRSLVRSFVKLKMPHEWGLVLSLALRYIPTIQSMYTVIAEAQQARGLNILREKGFQRVRVMMPIFIAMIISSLRASDQLAKALESRAFGASGVKRTTACEIQFCTLDYTLSLLILVITCGTLFLNLRFGIGVHPIQVIG